MALYQGVAGHGGALRRGAGPAVAAGDGQGQEKKSGLVASLPCAAVRFETLAAQRERPEVFGDLRGSGTDPICVASPFEHRVLVHFRRGDKNELHQLGLAVVIGHHPIRRQSTPRNRRTPSAAPPKSSCRTRSHGVTPRRSGCVGVVPVVDHLQVARGTHTGKVGDHADAENRVARRASETPL
jgi:hypothetical protein